MISKDINQITKDDLQDLVNNKIVEREMVEYKQELPGNSDKGKED